MTAYVKFREAGKRKFYFLNGSGAGTGLRVHAARFDSVEKAKAFIEANKADNPELEFKAVEA